MALLELGRDLGVGDVHRNDLAVLVKLAERPVARGLAAELLEKILAIFLGRTQRRACELSAELRLARKFRAHRRICRSTCGVTSASVTSILRSFAFWIRSSSSIMSFEDVTLNAEWSSRVFGRSTAPPLNFREHPLLQIEPRDRLITDDGDDAVEAHGPGRRGGGAVGFCATAAERANARSEKRRELISSSTGYPRTRARVRPWPSK